MPPVSEAQRRAMFAAAEGHSTLDIPQKVGREFVGKEMKRSDWRGLIAGLVKFFTEEEEEPEHAGDTEPTGRAASIAFIALTGKVLFVKRAAGEENFPDTWAFPGGKADGDETPEDCARRECREEIGDHPIEALTTVDRKITARGWEHTTFAATVADEFEPALNAEHSEYRWALPAEPPQPLHPGVAETLTKMVAEPPGAHDEVPDMLALDRSSARTYDADGRLHVERSNISKANICEYYGREIPNAQSLGLDADRKYRMLRDPVELERAAATFNNLPILSAHVPVTADAHKPELVIGSTGTDAKFEAPYLTNSLVFWTKEAIDPIESGEQRELSSAYRYRADMTPGTYQNEPYDGVMRDIKANHVVICREGRAGPDVMVGDSKESKPMKTRLTSLLAARAIKKLGLSGVSRDALALAMDEGMEGEDELDPNSALPAGMKKKAEAEDEAETEEEAAERKRNRAEDAKLGLACAGDEDPETEEERKDRLERRAADKRRGMDASKRMGRDETEAEDKERREKDRAEDRKARDSKRAGDAKAARDAKRGKDEENKDMVDKGAMDAAIQAASDATARRVTAEVRATERAIRDAETDVRPYVGELAMSFDSAEEVYRHALGMLKVPEAKTIHSSALPTILHMQQKAGARPAERATPALGMDAVEKATKIAPGLAHIGIGAI